jgi:hypothetical protein
MLLFKTKITEEDVTYGPTDPDELVAEVFALELAKKGYIGVSNAYCQIGRIDRIDWLDVMARARHCSRADFYNVDGSGIGEQHREHYVRCHTKDLLTVHPQIYQRMKKYRSQYDLQKLVSRTMV